MYEDRRRAGSFGDDAEQYDRARPSYPAELIDDLVGPDIYRALDVGCGTGIAARLFAAQAWHWVDLTIGAVKVASVLRPGGRFAVFWNTYLHAPEVHAAFTEVYQRYAPPLVTGSVTAGRSFNPRYDVHTAPLTASGLFEAIEWRRFPWQRVYRRDEWLDQLPTHSNHRTLPPETFVAVLAGIGTAIDRFGGQITVDHSASLLTTRRIPLSRSPNIASSGG